MRLNKLKITGIAGIAGNALLSSILRIILGAVLIFSAISKLLVSDDFELYLYHLPFFTWNISIIFARLIIGAELALGLFLILNVHTRKTLVLVFIMLIAFTIWLSGNLLLNNSEENCYCFGDAFHLNTGASILKNAVLIIMVIFLMLKGKSTFSKNLWLTTGIIAFSFIGPSIKSPPDFLMRNRYASNTDFIQTIPKGLFKNAYIKDDPQNIAGEENYMICFFSISCKHCFRAATLIGTMQKKSKDPLNIVYVFYQDPQEFLKENNSEDLPYYLFETSLFYKYSGKGVPSIMLVKNDSVLKKYSYRTINEPEILQFLRSGKIPE